MYLEHTSRRPVVFSVTSHSLSWVPPLPCLSLVSLEPHRRRAHLSRWPWPAVVAAQIANADCNNSDFRRLDSSADAAWLLDTRDTRDTCNINASDSDGGTFLLSPSLWDGQGRARAQRHTDSDKQSVSVPLTTLTKSSHHDSHWAYTTLFGCVWSCIGCSHIYAASLPVRDISFFSPFPYVLSLYHLAMYTRNHTRRSTFSRVPF
ncbi:hypothetical protein EV401DRAFT_257088 [Pisolithus croceorrhizus]|nr:hypothetical protein EV401DRAFT_257088 [Pisolithus croceorrhizus]